MYVLNSVGEKNYTVTVLKYRTRVRGREKEKLS